MFTVNLVVWCGWLLRLVVLSRYLFGVLVVDWW